MTSVNDKPVWNADMDYWLDNNLTVTNNPKYKSSSSNNTTYGIINTISINDYFKTLTSDNFILLISIALVDYPREEVREYLKGNQPEYYKYIIKNNLF